MGKITIIDDDIEHAENLGIALKGDGHEVTTLDDTAGAVEILMGNKPDVVVLDVMFPENPSAGFDLARKIRQTAEIADLPILLLTGVNQEFPMDFSSDDIDAEWMPVQEFLEKPVDLQELLKKVKTLLAG